MSWDNPSMYTNGAFSSRANKPGASCIQPSAVYEVFTHYKSRRSTDRTLRSSLSTSQSRRPIEGIPHFFQSSSRTPTHDLEACNKRHRARLISLVPGGSLIPAIIQACHDSRREALKLYRPLTCGSGKSEIEYPILSDHDNDIAFAHETCVEHITGNMLPWAIKRAIKTKPYIFKHKHVAINICHLLNQNHHPFTPYAGRWGFSETWDLLHQYNPHLETLMLILKYEHAKTFDDLAELDEDEVQKAHFDEARSNLKEAQKDGKLLSTYFQVAVFENG
ncbi:hypothetical protein B0J14DRAFT_649158 [Halenospora varia]|nr:hypothetical protein B0J14DRAFT_649158 [Halenospora varia]